MAFKVPVINPNNLKTLDQLVDDAMILIEAIWNRECPDEVEDKFEKYISIGDIWDNIPVMFKDRGKMNAFWDYVAGRIPEGFTLIGGGRDAGSGRTFIYKQPVTKLPRD